MAPALALFNEENTGRLVCLPFTLAAISTNYDGWRLDAQEQKELAATGSVALNEWVRVDPKWVALLLFSLSLAGVATAKAIGYQAELRARGIDKINEMKRRAAAAQGPKPNEKDASGEASGFASSPTPEPPALPS